MAEATYDGTAAATHLTEAYELLDDLDVRMRVAKMLSQALVFAGRPGAPTAFARRAQRDLVGASPDDLQALMAIERTSGYLHDALPADWQPSSIQLQGGGPGARRLAVSLAWEKLIAATDREQATDLARFAVADGVLRRDDVGLFWAVAGSILEMGDAEQGSLWDDAIADAQARGSLFSALAVHVWRGYSQWRQGELREAYISLSAGNEFTRQYGGVLSAPYSHAFFTQLLIDQGRIAEARAFYESVRHDERIGDGQRLRRQAECSLLLAEARFGEALELTFELEPMMAYVRNPVWRELYEQRARALAGVDRRDEAVEWVDLDEELARSWGAPRAIGRALLVRGEVTGDVAALRAAAAVFESAPAPVDLIRTRLLLAAAIEDEDEAIELLEQSVRTGDVIGALGLRAAAARRLASLGRSAPTQPAILTLSRTERRIAALAASGADARDIAQRLFLTPRIARQVLDDVRDRLQVASDDELRAALAS